MVINVNKSSSVKISDFLLVIRYYEIDFLCQTVKEKLFFKTWFDKKKSHFTRYKNGQIIFFTKTTSGGKIFFKNGVIF